MLEEQILENERAIRVVAKDDGNNFIVDCPFCGAVHIHPREKGRVKIPCGKGKIIGSAYWIKSTFKLQKPI